LTSRAAGISGDVSQSTSTGRAARKFLLVNVAVGFTLDAARICQACLPLEGIASIIWHSPAAEAVLEDLSLSPVLGACAASAALVLSLFHNTFQVEIQRDSVDPTIMAVASLLRQEADLVSDMDMKVKNAQRQIDVFFDAQTRS
jgi:hypothetical protein